MAILILGGETFRSKAAVQKRIQQILQNTPPGASVIDHHLPLLSSLFARHPDAEQKIGVGIARVLVEEEPRWQTKCLWIERKDGTRTDISYRECLSPATAYGGVVRAMRAAVSADVIRFKSDAFSAGPVLCAISGRRVTLTECDADHAPPHTFSRIMHAFLTQQSLHATDVAVDYGGDGCTEPHLADLGLEERWIAFHRAHAVLRILARSVHVATRSSEEPAL